MSTSFFCRKNSVVLFLAASAVCFFGCASSLLPPPSTSSAQETALAPRDSLAQEYEKSGRQEVMVFYTPGNPPSVQGYLHLGQVYSERVPRAGAGDAGANLSRLDALVDALDDFTEIKADFAPNLTYADPRLFALPIVVPLSLPNEIEMEQLSRYLTEGGFVLVAAGFIGDGRVSNGFDDFREGLEKYSELVWGQDVLVERLPDDHPLFSSYFKLSGAATTDTRALGDDAVLGGNLQRGMEGLFIKGRLAGVVFNLPQTAPRNSERPEDTLSRQMAVNIIVYALIQEGSLAQRLMQQVH